jgi:hypothetical protein
MFDRQHWLDAVSGYEGRLSVYDKSFNDNAFSTPTVPAPGVDASPQAIPVSAAVQRFQTCRWRRPAENGTPECCGHRDVLPLTGTNGFDPEAWCPECAFYKLRRTPKKRDDYDFGY